MSLRSRTKGCGPWKYEWYSVCSVHHPTRQNDDCIKCNTGRWINTWKLACGHVIFDNFPALWIWWANRNKPKMTDDLPEDRL